MPDLGRWYGMDQLSEMYHDSSPYAYVGNNPIMFVDPDGRCKNRPEGEPCPESPGGSKNPVNIEEVVVGQTYPTDNSPASPPYTGPSFLSFLSSYYGGSSGAAGGDGGGAPVDPWVQYRKDLADYNLMRSRQTLYNAIGDQRDDLHVLLGGLGNIPVFGELFDGLDGAIYALRGDNVNAAASFSAMIPLIGVGTKYTIKGIAHGGKQVLKFTGDEAIGHFGKHGKSIMDASGRSAYNLKDYVNDANWIIQNGTYNPKLNGYYYFMGNAPNGTSIFGFVGVKNSGLNISTFHIKSATQLGLK